MIDEKTFGIKISKKKEETFSSYYILNSETFTYLEYIDIEKRFTEIDFDTLENKEVRVRSE